MNWCLEHFGLLRERLRCCHQARRHWRLGSWRLSTENVLRVSGDEVRDLKKPLNSDFARMSIPRVHWIQLVEGCRYKALKLL